MARSVVTYEPATEAHLAHVAANMRAADRAEIAAGSGLDPLTALRVSARVSDRAVCALADGRPVLVFGVCPASLAGGEGCPWALGTDEVERHARRMLTDAREWLEVLGEGYGRLHNRVHAGNVRHVAWLKRMGFDVKEAVPSGRGGHLFHDFEMTRGPRDV